LALMGFQNMLFPIIRSSVQLKTTYCHFNNRQFHLRNMMIPFRNMMIPFQNLLFPHEMAHISRRRA